MSSCRIALLLTLSLNLSCAHFRKPDPATDPLSTAEARERAAAAREHAAIAARDSIAAANSALATANAALAKRASVLDLKLLGKEAQVEDLQSRVEELRVAVVQARSQIQTTNGRAGAASGMAEAEVALQSLKSVASPQYPDVVQATRLLRQSSAAFDKNNYGGAIFLAGQAKGLALAARGRLTTTNRLRAARTGETEFVVPVRLRVTLPGNVREGPGALFPAVFAVAKGAPLTGLSYTDDWVRISDARKRTGWIDRSMVDRR